MQLDIIAIPKINPAPVLGSSIPPKGRTVTVIAGRAESAVIFKMVTKSFFLNLNKAHKPYKISETIITKGTPNVIKPKM